MVSITVQVQVLKGPIFNVELPSESSLTDLRVRIQRETLVAPQHQRLILNNAKVLAQEGRLQDCGVVDKANVKMVVAGAPAHEFSRPPPLSDDELGRAFQVGFSLVRSQDGKKLVDQMIASPDQVEGILQRNELASDMMSNPKFLEIVKSREFLNALNFALTGEELPKQEIEPPKVPEAPKQSRPSHAEALAVLMEMGFPEEVSTAALVANNDDLNAALQSLTGP